MWVSTYDQEMKEAIESRERSRNFIDYGPSDTTKPAILIKK